MSKFPRSLAAVYVANGLNGLVSVITVPVALRLLGLSGYGLFSIYVLLVNYIPFADFGIGKNLLRLLAQPGRAEERHRQIGIALGLYVLLCGAWFAAAPVLAFAVPRYVFPVEAQFLAAVRWMVVLSVLEFALGVPVSLMLTACVAGQRFEAYSRFTLVSGLLRNGAILVGAVAFRDPAAVAAVVAGRKVVEYFLGTRLLGRLPAAARRPVFDIGSFRGMVDQTATLSVAQALNSTLMAIGSPLVNAAFGLQALGVYRAASDLAGKITFVSNGITLVVFPRAARYFGSGFFFGAAARVSAVLHASATLYTSFAAICVIAAPYVLPPVGLPNAAVRLFLLLSIALSLNAHASMSNELIQASGRYRLSIRCSGSALGTLVALFLAAMPFAGTMAIGWAWIGAALVSACVADGVLLRLCGASRAQKASATGAKTAAAAACTGLALRQLGFASGGAAGLCGLVLLTLAVLAARGTIPLLRATGGTGVHGEAVAPPVCG